MKILFFGDIIGKIGRQGLKKILPEYKKEFSPDLIIANGENIAHGTGITEKIITEMNEAGIDFFTSGNHIFRKPDGEKLVSAPNPIIIQPANYLPDKFGPEYKILEVGSRAVLIINLLGRVFMHEEFECPFKKIDKILDENKDKNISAILVDFHAEATSEKQAFGWYLDGRASAVIGTHTHVPTADNKILPQGTAYITDVGMVGAIDSVIGDTKEPIIESFLNDTNPPINIPEAGEVQVDAILLEIDPNTKKATSIKRVDKKIKV